MQLGSERSEQLGPPAVISIELKCQRRSNAIYPAANFDVRVICEIPERVRVQCVRHIHDHQLGAIRINFKGVCPVR